MCSVATLVRCLTQASLSGFRTPELMRLLVLVSLTVVFLYGPRCVHGYLSCSTALRCWRPLPPLTDLAAVSHCHRALTGPAGGGGAGARRRAGGGTRRRILEEGLGGIGGAA
uniref:Uncharacterized protein n=1 Tax=Arundo donax TaxID=35708 RepID=A0A0A9HWT8_ARUDO